MSGAGGVPVTEVTDMTLRGRPASPCPSFTSGDDPVSELLEQARGGDQLAWDAIVERFSGLALGHRTCSPTGLRQAADVIQNTWLRLVENLDRIQDPERLGAWLATTARRECLRTIRLGTRELPTDEEWMWDVASDDEIDSGLIARERDRRCGGHSGRSASAVRRYCG